MIVFTLKMFNNVRKAIAGRRYPHQLGWRRCFGSADGDHSPRKSSGADRFAVGVVFAKSIMQRSLS